MKMGYGTDSYWGWEWGISSAPYNDSLARTGWAWGCTLGILITMGSTCTLPMATLVDRRQKIIAPSFGGTIFTPKIDSQA